MGKIIAIAAVARDRAIGRQNKMPWHIKEDLKRFSDLTKTHTVLMGRKTYESIGRPLTDRTNVVLSMTRSEIPGVECISDLNNFILDFKYNKDSTEKLWIIGGEQIYCQTLGLCDNICLTEIDGVFQDCDCFFPKIDGDKFRLIATSPSMNSGQISYRYTTYARK